jgi:hypothetical protein
MVEDVAVKLVDMCAAPHCHSACAQLAASAGVYCLMLRAVWVHAFGARASPACGMATIKRNEFVVLMLFEQMCGGRSRCLEVLGSAGLGQCLALSH